MSGIGSERIKKVLYDMLAGISTSNSEGIVMMDLKEIDFVAWGSLLVAVSALIYTFASNTKRYELKSQFRKDILDWYAETIEILIRLEKENKPDSNYPKNELLAKLSALVEVGRFYFPNVDHGDGFGKSKPLAYRGYRDLGLDFLVFSYDLFERSDAHKHKVLARKLQRHFTSHVFEAIDPNGFLKETHRLTDKNSSLTKRYRLEDLLDNDSKFFDDLK